MTLSGIDYLSWSHKTVGGKRQKKLLICRENNFCSEYYRLFSACERCRIFDEQVIFGDGQVFLLLAGF